MLQEIVVLTVAYIVLVGLFQPKKKTVAPIAVDAPINYFPEVEEVTEEEAIAAEPVTVEFQPTAEVIVEPIKKPSVAVPTDLTNLSIRQLKKLASAAKIKRYSSLTKAQLIDRLAALEVAAIARKSA